MPSVSKAQQRFMGLVHAYKKGEVPASQVSQAVKDAAKSMKKKSTKKFASTKHKGLPNKVRSENMNEDGHTDVASAERKLKLIMKDAMDTLNALKNLSNEDSLPSWWTDKITLAKDYVGKSRDYIMNPAESVNEGKFDRIASQLIKDLDKEFPIGKYNPKKVSDFNKLVKHLKSKMSKLSNVNIGHLATDYHNYRQGQTDKERRPAIKGLVKTLKRIGIKESVDEKKNPKREKLKKDFNKRLLALEKQVRRVKQFAKSNDWGRVSAFVEDGLVNDIEDLARYTREISTLPVNENAQKVAKLLIKYGNNTKDVKDMIKKHYKKAKKDRSKSTPSELANYISFLSANESVNEGKGVEKILKMADEKSFGKIAGRTVDGMTAGLFKAVYDKAPQNAKDKIDKMSEKQLYVFMGKLWNKFGRQVKLS